MANAEQNWRQNLPQPARGPGGDISQAWSVNVKDFGARGDGVTDDWAAIQGAVDAVTALYDPATDLGGGTICLPPGLYLTRSPIYVAAQNIRLLGAGRNATVIRNAVSDVIVFGARPQRWWDLEHRQVVAQGAAPAVVNPHNFECRDMTLQAYAEPAAARAGQGGNIFKVVPSVVIGEMLLENLILQQMSPVHSIWHQVDDSGGGGFMFNRIVGCEMKHWHGKFTGALPRETVEPTVPAWNLELVNCSSNLWMRCTAGPRSGTAPFFRLNNLSVDALAADNAFRDIAFEVPLGGCIECWGMTNTVIDNCSTQDIGSAVPPARVGNDMFVFGANEQGQKSRNVAIRNCMRHDDTQYHRPGARRGDPDYNFLDVRLVGNPEDVSNVVIENCRSKDRMFGLKLDDHPALVVAGEVDGHDIDKIAGPGNLTWLRLGGAYVSGKVGIFSGAGRPRPPDDDNDQHEAAGELLHLMQEADEGSLYLQRDEGGRLWAKVGEEWVELTCR